MIVARIAVLAALALPAAAAAQGTTGLVHCEDHWSHNFSSLSLGPDNEGVRHFYDGQVTVMRLDTEEPAAASFGVSVVFPDGNGDLGPVGLACWLNWGFGFVDVAATQSAYDPAQGLTLTIPTGRYDPETGGTRPGAPIRWLINLAQGSITDLDAHDGHDH